jgi:hypothetical protein
MALRNTQIGTVCASLALCAAFAEGQTSPGSILNTERRWRLSLSRAGASFRPEAASDARRKW